MALKIIFAGTPQFAVPVLQKIITSPHSLCAVYTKLDSPSGRGQKLTCSPVKEFAMQHGLPIYQPATLKDELAQQVMRELGADILVDVACGLLLPKAVLTMFKYGCINVHPSLLPRWRGAAPIQRAIMAGDKKAGVTIMQLDEGWDTGDILRQDEIVITNTDTTVSLSAKLAEISADLILNVLQDIELGTIIPVRQDNSYSCYAAKITKEEARINWQKEAAEIDCVIRAFNPWPVAFSVIDEEIVRIWRAEPLLTATHAKPGVIVQVDKKGIDVATGSGILRILELQLAGGKILPVAAVLNSKQDLFKAGKNFNV